MAKLITQSIQIKISKMVRDSESSCTLLDADLLEQLEAVITELAGEGVLVEVEVE